MCSRPPRGPRIGTLIGVRAIGPPPAHSGGAAGGAGAGRGAGGAAPGLLVGAVGGGGVVAARLALHHVGGALGGVVGGPTPPAVADPAGALAERDPAVARRAVVVDHHLRVG